METNQKQETPKAADNVMSIIKQTPPAQIADLPFVHKKYVQNYNSCHKEKVGELMYHRNAVHFKQALLNSKDLASSDPFSLYACFVTAAVNGYSLDPADNEVYLLPLGGKAYLWRQAGAHVRRLMTTNQIQFAEQAKLVYEGDELHVENGRVVKHVEKFQTENIIAGYVRFVVDEKGADRFFIYRKSDWESWKKKSMQKAGENWTGNNGQPGPGFLRTKIVKHAALEKCWAIGNTSVPEQYAAVEIDEPEEAVVINGNGSNGHTVKQSQVITPQKNTPIVSAEQDDESFVQQPTSEGVTVEDDNF